MQTVIEAPTTLQALAAAVAANMAHPAMSCADPLTECLVEQCLGFSRPPAAGPTVVPCSTLARWWLAVKRWLTARCCR